MEARPELFVTNFNPRLTGVSTTAASVARALARDYALRVVGEPLPGLPEPISLLRALVLSVRRPVGRRFSIWHVRRNSEMLVALLARKVLRLPIRTVFTSAATRRHSFFPRFLISQMDFIIATLDAAGTYLDRPYRVVPHGVDIEMFRPAMDRTAAWKALGFPGSRGVATIGRIRPEKGTDRFVNAMIAALPQLPDVTALVVGRVAPAFRNFHDGLVARVAAAGLSDRILFPGEMQHETLARVLPGLDLLVALPRYEGYGMTPIEAMACGVPVALAKAGHFQAFVGDGETGSIVDDDTESVAQSIVALMNDPERHATLARAARRRVEQQFNVFDEAKMIAEVYEDLWRGRPAQSSD